MPLVVQKYGGTSVNTPAKRAKVLDRIIAAKEQKKDVVVVVSAMGRKGEPYATDTLLDLLLESGPAPTGRTKDLMASCGEIISACLVSQALKARGYRAEAVTGFQAGIVTDAVFGNAETVKVNPERIKRSLQQGNIVVAAGFQGVTEEMEVTTLGRGGSDITALILGGALEADQVEIYTDVPGVAFTDPRLAAGVPFLKSIDFAPMYTLARAGAKIIHQRAVKSALNFRRPFVVRSTFGDEPGTLIGQSGESYQGLYGLALLTGVGIIKAGEYADEAFFKGLALDEMFFKRYSGGCTLAVDTSNSSPDAEGGGYAAKGECGLVTAAWDPHSGLSPETIGSLIKGRGLEVVECFNVPQGASWALPEKQAVLALRLLVDYAFPDRAEAIS